MYPLAITDNNKHMMSSFLVTSTSLGSAGMRQKSETRLGAVQTMMTKAEMC